MKPEKEFKQRLTSRDDMILTFDLVGAIGAKCEFHIPIDTDFSTS